MASPDASSARNWRRWVRAVDKLFFIIRAKFVSLQRNMKRIWIAIVRLCGWRLLLPAKGERPELSRCVFAVAPHTAVSDFLIGAAYLWQLDVNGCIFIKKEFFRWPLGGLLRRLGAIPIDRGNRHNDMVGRAVREFAKGGSLALAITPEGTRKPVRRWKRGFWEIARQAGVPISVAKRWASSRHSIPPTTSRPTSSRFAAITVKRWPSGPTTSSN